ncbi:MAG: hypothetical protein IPJ86_06435 [Bacteroidetes bacterium]|nr:hypothetical protein [Bacteroidota bacterium]
MFDIFKQDIKIGDKVKLYLTTGKEPEGIVVSIGENFVLLQANDNTQNRFFDKLIGGWEVILKINTEVFEEKTRSIEEKFQKKEILEAATSLRQKLDRVNEFIKPNANIIDVRGKRLLLLTKNIIK